MQLHDLTLTELSAGLAAKKFSSRDIVDALLGRIAKANDKLHAFTEVYAKEAKAMADGADKARAGGFPLGPLHGLPIAYKDLCDIAGRIGTGGSKMFAKRVATETSNTVERLTAAGMVPLGKELATTGVLVNCVAPAVVKTELFSQMTEQHIQYMLSKIPMNRFGEVEEVAEMVAWLASDLCTFATGATFDLSGGRATY